MSAKYFPVSQDEQNVLHFLDTKHEQKHPWRKYSFISQVILISLLAANLALWMIPLLAASTEHTPIDYARAHDLSTTWANFRWNTAYSPAGQNHTESDELWERILPSHGFVAVDRKWAEANRWPVSMYLPSDHKKGVYLLEAYHQLHCLRILRKTFWEAVEAKPYTYHLSHAEHCFDALRQSAICNADSTPLYTFGDFTAGDGQLHKCRDWDELRAYATKNTACYKDTVQNVPLGDHFGFCDEGNDGIFARL